MAVLRLIDLPPEILIAIASFLGSTGGISRLARTNRHLHRVLESYLYKYDVATARSSPKALRISSCFPRSVQDVNRIIQKSLAAGADVNALLDVIAEKDPTERRGDTFHTTAISMAALTGNAALVRILLDAGANVNATCWLGVSVLGYAMVASNMEVLRVLLAQPGVDLGSWCRQQDTALLTAVAQGALDFAEALLPLADPNQTGREGITPLRLAVREQNYDMVSLLLSDGRTDPNDMAVGHGEAQPHGSILALASSLPNTAIIKLLYDDSRTEVDRVDGSEDYGRG